MHLTPPEPAHIEELRNWFPSSAALLAWGGPNMTFPNTPDSFTRELHLNALSSFALLDGDMLAGFGQYYERLGHCHLGRLAINPTQRNLGLGQILINSLRQRGEAQLGLEKSSLFVLQDNHQAIRAYRNAGFTKADYPEPMPLENCLYMTASALHGTSEIA